MLSLLVAGLRPVRDNISDALLRGEGKTMWMDMRISTSKKILHLTFSSLKKGGISFYKNSLEKYINKKDVTSAQNWVANKINT